MSALALWEGDLIPEAGPVDWIIGPREAQRRQAAAAASAAAQLHLELGQAAGAKAACERGLAIDRYRDELWRLLIEACEADGDAAGAAVARRSYESVLSELGVVATLT
jgi:DNA-binding SARP family transcriptional activator